MTVTKHWQIRLLEIGYERNAVAGGDTEALGYKELLEEMSREFPSLSTSVIFAATKENYRFAYNQSHNSDHHEGKNTSITLKTEGFFRLIDYFELREAREASLNAQQQSERAFHQAKYALFISAALAIASIGISLWAVTNPQDVRVLTVVQEKLDFDALVERGKRAFR